VWWVGINPWDALSRLFRRLEPRKISRKLGFLLAKISTLVLQYGPLEWHSAHGEIATRNDTVSTTGPLTSVAAIAARCSEFSKEGLKYFTAWAGNRV
jgi:hypothetical protein